VKLHSFQEKAPHAALRAPTVPYLDQSRRIALIGGVAAMVVGGLYVSDSLWGRDSLMEAVLKSVGQCLIMAAVLGRLWATLYIGGRKNACLITKGPYSLSRNPLYFFSILGAVGAGLVFGSLAAALLLGGAIWLLLDRAARDEAELLCASFGASYADYAERVPLLWPRVTGYADATEPSFRPSALGRALRDGLLFLLPLPIAELAGYAKAAGLLPRLLPLF
jgi:protein-S-isoprenylcysteine O-methyltransferase Ste14